MSLQWTAVASFLYFEVFIIIVLCLPFISPTRWQKIFRSRMLTIVVNYANFYFNVFILVLVLLFIDGWRESRKYSTSDNVDLKNNPMAIDHVNMKLFRAQRNLYISGFALLLWFVLRRLVILISQQATLVATNEAFKKQAEGASDAARKYMDENEKLKQALEESGAGDGVLKLADEKEKLSRELKEAKENLDKAKKGLVRSENECRAMKSQAEGVATEYDRLLEEHAQLQKQLEGSPSKKDE
ncbi:B-cell receptor-associated protein 31 [Lampetra fluviatilis]